MKKVLGVISFIVMLIGILGISSCGESKGNTEFDTYDSIFIDNFSNEDDIKQKKIESLTSYYYNTRYFYEVCYKKNTSEESKSVKVLYVFRYYSLKKFFNIQNEDECYKYFSDYYEYYLEAKEKGIKKEYSNSDVKSLIENFYDISLE